MERADAIAEKKRLNLHKESELKSEIMWTRTRREGRSGKQQGLEELVNRER